jgi:hypothetical protein
MTRATTVGQGPATKHGQQGPPTSAPTPPRQRRWLTILLRQRSVQLALAGWAAGNLLILTLAGDTLPFDRPALAGRSVTQQILQANLALLEVLLLIGVTYLLTRNRTIPDVAARAPQRALARRETLLLLGYGVLGQLGGLLLGRLFGWHPFGFHLAGTLYGTHEMVSAAEAITWAGYNLTVYAIVPYLLFRRRYSAEALNLTSTNRRHDLLVIVVVFAIEATAQMSVLSADIFQVHARQLLLGAPLTFMLYFVGTVLPAMVFIYCILVPRYLKLTGSVATTVLLGGLTYMLAHSFDAWTAFGSARDALLSLAFLVFAYVGPGMVKTVLTLRTGNAWVHVWAYHALAPHTLMDTPLIVKVFHIR